MGTTESKAKAAKVSRPIVWCADCDGKIYDYDILIYVNGKPYCGACGPDQQAAFVEEIQLEDGREMELENGR